MATLAFSTVTNNHYFCGTVATVNSVRRFYPEAPIYVFPEVRWPLTESQRLWLSRVPRLSCVDAEDVPGSVKEAWQQKAHGARLLTSRPVSSHLVLIDSDLVLASPIDEMIGLVESHHVPCGGQDGDGVFYGPEYWPYINLCQSTLPRSDHFNPKYMSSSLCVLPCDRQHQTICRLWSQAVDQAATFGPGTPDQRTYQGFSDQGILNAILFFSQVTPVLMDNDTVSEHWVHGTRAVTRAGNAFVKGDKRMIAFHSVGHGPKFWQSEYRAFVSDVQPNLDAVYDYWLTMLFDGPVGLLRMFDMPWLTASDLFAEHAHLPETYRDHLQADSR